MSVSRRFCLPFGLLGISLAVLVPAGPASATATQVDLGTATSFAVLAGARVTNTGPSSIAGDVGVSPGSAVTGFPVGQPQSGTIHASDAVALQAKSDLGTAFVAASGQASDFSETGQDLGGQTLVPGVYSATSTLALTGTLTLDARGDPDAVFVFQVGSALDAATHSSIALLNDAQACHVFWQVGSSATLGVGAHFVGSVLAQESITLKTGATLEGRALARTGQVALDTNTITRPRCSTVATSTPTVSVTPTISPSVTTAPTDTPDSTPTAGPSTAAPTGGTTMTDSSTPTASAPTSTIPTASTSSPSTGSTDSGSSGSGGSGGSGGGSGRDLLVPLGHPETGRPVIDQGADRRWLLAALCFGAAGLVLAAASLRRRS